MQDRTSYRAPIRIALDAMGGDFAPAMAIKGALRAARAFDITLILVGDENILWRELEKHKYQGLSLEVRHAPEVIEMGEKPHHMIRKKKRSSLRVAFDLVRNDEAHAIVSAGNSGAVLYGALFVLKRLKHVIRPGIAARMPSASGTVVIIDAGANAICKPENLIEFAVMGSGYFQHVFEIPEPRVGVLSNGEEDSKGTDLTRDTHEQLKKTKLNYIGYVEGRDVFAGKVDVVVCDGFTGNIVIKTAEGVAQNFISVLKSEISRSFFARIGYLMS
ncbi:MAG TPA: phosphate acyltransferase PlsX, partial [Thermodesulfobacteriota bacterium]|nr:phosphate acyltransferase PlsX [Thermodesulfobacteriota bacterium]